MLGQASAYPPGNYFSLQYFSVALLEAKLPFLEALSTLVITDANWAPRRATEKILYTKVIRIKFPGG